MSKQDRQGVRTPQDLERKYNLAGMDKAIKQHSEGITKTNKILEEFVNKTVKNFQEVQKGIDSKSEIWFYDGEPSMESLPVTDWSEEEYELHVGDLYYDKETGYAYRFEESEGVYSWEPVKDRDTVEALALANAAKDTADGKRRVFMEQPAPPYDRGDLWLKDKEIYVCQIAKADGAKYETADFTTATKYTDDTVALGVGQRLDRDYSTTAQMEAKIKASNEVITTEMAKTYVTKDTYTGLEATVGKVETKATQTAEKFNWLVKSGTSASDFEITDRMASLTADYINLKGLVQFKGLNTDTQNLINAIKSTAESAESTANTASNNASTAISTANTASSNASTAISTANSASSTASTANTNASNALTKANTAITDSATAKTNAATALSTANTAKSTADSVNSKIASWCAKEDVTLIDGGKIYTGSVTADKISVNSLEAICAKIGGFSIGSKYLANNTTTLAGVDSSVYLGLDGISCGKTFKVTPDGYLFAEQASIGPFQVTSDALWMDYTGNDTNDFYVWREHFHVNAIDDDEVVRASLTADYANTGVGVARVFGYGRVEISTRDRINFCNNTEVFGYMSAVDKSLSIDGKVIAVEFEGDLNGYASGLTGLTATIAELNYCDGVTSNIQTQLNNKMNASISNIELKPSTSSTHGGYIDFHYAGSTADYTSRIIENASGTLSINGVTITNGKVVTATTFSGALSGNATSATNADKLDGYHADSFPLAYSGYGKDFFGSTDLDTWLRAGQYAIASGATNAPSARGTDTWGTMFVVKGLDGRLSQYASFWNETGGPLWYRHLNSSTWSTWSKVRDGGSAATATKATQDASGNVITSTYATKSALNDISDSLATLLENNLSTAISIISKTTYTIPSDGYIVAKAHYSSGSYISYALYGADSAAGFTVCVSSGDTTNTKANQGSALFVKKGMVVKSITSTHSSNELQYYKLSA